jgi:hypothetical protein
MEFNFLLGKYVNMVPNVYKNSAWVTHIPFMMFLIENFKPRRFVELGTHWGASYFAACQTVDFLELQCECIAIDHWRGEEHAGTYSDEVFSDVTENNKIYKQFSKLVRKTFEEGLAEIEDDSIELLHIDGFHSYEAVVRDFKSAYPKLNKNKSIVLFHDINEYQDGFGVHKFWQEIKENNKTLEFKHGHGLGVVFLGSGFPIEITRMIDNLDNQSFTISIQAFFEILGNRIEKIQKVSELVSLNSQHALSRAALSKDYSSLLSSHKNLEKELNSMQNSSSWKLTLPMRKFMRILRNIWS